MFDCRSIIQYTKFEVNNLLIIDSYTSRGRMLWGFRRFAIINQKSLFSLQQWQRKRLSYHRIFLETISSLEEENPKEFAEIYWLWRLTLCLNSISTSEKTSFW